MKLETIERYRKYLKAHGYGDSTIALYIRTIGDLQEPSAPDSPASLVEFVDQSLLQKKNTLSDSNFKSARAALRQFFSMITGTRFKDFQKTLYSKDQYEPLMERFADYCSGFLHLSDAVILASIRDVRRFLITVVPDIEEVSWSMITAQDIVKFLGNECSNLCPASVGVTVTAIRRFFRFLRNNDETTHSSVLNLPLSTPNWSKNSSLPVVLSAEDKISLDGHEFPESRTGHRDRAILYCFTELGLRCCEVAGLCLADIKWNQGTIVIRKTKTRSARELPMSEKLGLALEDYVIRSRPKDLGDPLFFKYSSGDTLLPATTECIRGVIRRIFSKNGITGWHVGTHALRRSVGSDLYAAGNGLKTVADLLGHNTVSATKAYVRIDIDSLREVVSPWPERGIA